jgi:hypothetical protein
VTAPTSAWEAVGPVQAGEDSRDLYRQAARYLFRIVTEDGALTAPSLPTMQRAGLLLRRQVAAAPTANRGQFVQVTPLSADAMR